MAGAVFLTLAVAVGGALDYARLVNARAVLQKNVDAATLSAARKPDEPARKVAFRDMMSLTDSNEDSYTLIPNQTGMTGGGTTLVGEAAATVNLIFGPLMARGDMSTISARAEVGLLKQSVEVALVVDMSSSMIEDGRFAPAQDAVKTFITKLEGSNSSTVQARLSIVPFSSRVNFGTARPNIFGMWNGADAIPDRWVHPEDYHDMTKWEVGYWIDNVTKRLNHETWTRWLGCAEPRLDVAIEQGATSYTPTDDAPADIPMIAMDHNSQPGLTFCPPPIQPLTGDSSRLLRAADALSSQGSTRLDAGMAGGWYTLSPKWASTWGSGHAPAAYGDANTQKIVVFMTDGGMNTMDDPTAYAYDWVCKASGDCDDRAEASLLQTCAAMKDLGIEIYSVSYGQYADRTFVKTCASSESHFFIATTADMQEDYIETIYQRIADKIIEPSATLRN